MSVLKKIRVVEFAEGVPGPLAALRLSDLGADVIKVETEDGDWLRHAATLRRNGSAGRRDADQGPQGKEAPAHRDRT
jgi:crotonobetainyl-CoA:carnitine CoA-transferase CaiB-like acyl-CoA transferase